MSYFAPSNPKPGGCWTCTHWHGETTDEGTRPNSGNTPLVRFRDIFMEPVTLESIRAILDQANKWPPGAYVLAAIAVFGPAATAFLGAYAKKRGETSASKHDIELIMEELRRTTRVAEEVKAAISFRDWHTRESVALKRNKLELLYDCVWLHDDEMSIWWKHRALGLDGTAPATPSAGIARIVGLASFYFPTLKAPALTYASAASGFMGLALDFARRLHESTPEEQVAIFTKAKDVYVQEYPAVHATREALLDACVTLMPDFLSH